MSGLARGFIMVYDALDEEDQKEVTRALLPRMAEIAVSLEPVMPAATDNPSLLPKKRIGNDTPGVLSGNMRGHEVVVTQIPWRRFRTRIDGVEYRRLSMDLVEEELGCPVNRKSNGSNSETLARAPYRKLAYRYNNGDETVSFKAI